MTGIISRAETPFISDPAVALNPDTFGCVIAHLDNSSIPLASSVSKLWNNRIQKEQARNKWVKATKIYISSLDFNKYSAEISSLKINLVVMNALFSSKTDVVSQKKYEEIFKSSFPKITIFLRWKLTEINVTNHLGLDKTISEM